jgi:hypothetical protein
MMPRISVFSAALLLLVFFFLNSREASAQVSRPFRYSDDIGLDFAPYLRGEPGISLLYKHALGNTSDIELKKRFALRILLGFYESSYGYLSQFRQIADTTFFFEGAGENTDRYISGGVELQLRKNKFRWHVGFDLGYRRGTSSGKSQDITESGGKRFVTARRDHESKYNVAEGSILAGVNYFFLPRFSVGIEANLSLAIEFSKSKVLQNGMVTLQDSGTLFEVDTRLWRLLSLNYHFGKPAGR